MYRDGRSTMSRMCARLLAVALASLAAAAVPKGRGAETLAALAAKAAPRIESRLKTARSVQDKLVKVPSGGAKCGDRCAHYDVPDLCPRNETHLDGVHLRTGDSWSQVRCDFRETMPMCRDGYLRRRGVQLEGDDWRIGNDAMNMERVMSPEYRMVAPETAMEPMERVNKPDCANCLRGPVVNGTKFHYIMIRKGGSRLIESLLSALDAHEKARSPRSPAFKPQIRQSVTFTFVLEPFAKLMGITRSSSATWIATATTASSTPQLSGKTGNRKRLTGSAARRSDA